MMHFRSFAIGVVGALVLFQLHHLHQHLHDDAADSRSVIVLPQASEATPGPARWQRPGDRAPSWRPESWQPGARPFRALRPRPVAIADDTILVDIARSTIEQKLHDTGLARQARVVPVLHHGRRSGIKLYAVRPDSLLAVLGIRNGDTILAINDQPLDGSSIPDIDFAARMPDYVDISLRRAGKDLRLVVLLH